MTTMKNCYYIKASAGEGWPKFATIEDAIHDFVLNAAEFEHLSADAWTAADDATDEPDVWTVESANAYLTAIAAAYESHGGNLWMDGRGGVIGRQEYSLQEVE